MEIENPRSEGSHVLSSGPPLRKQDDRPTSTGPLLDEQDDHATSNGPIIDEQDDYPTSSDPPLGKQDDHSTSTCPLVDKDTDHPPSIGCISGFEQGKACNSTCVNQKAENKEDALVASLAKKIKQEPGTVRVKEEPIDLDDDDDVPSTRKDDEDDDDCIILLEVVLSSQKRKEKPKAASDITEIMIISDDDDDDEDAMKGDEEPTTSSQNETPKETAATDLNVTTSLSEDIEVNQVKKVTDTPHSLLEQSSDKGDPISKAVCEVVKEFSDHLLSASSTDLDGKEKADAHIQSVSDIVIAISPAGSNGSEKEGEDATSSRLGWTEDNLKDAWPFPEPTEEEESTDQANIISGQDEKAKGLQEEDVSFGEGYDSDGWEVNSDDEPKKDATKTDENASKRRETEVITERSDKDLSTRQEEGDTNSRPVQIIPLDSDLSSRQDGSLVPIGIIPVASEVITGGTGEFGKDTLVSPVTKANAAPTEPTQGDSATTAKNDGLPRRKAAEASVDEKIRGAVTRSKLRSSSNFVKEMSDNEISCKKSVEQSLREVIQGNSPAVDPVFNCHLCFQSFREKKLLEKHLVNHPEVTRIMCKYCNKSFQKQSYLTVHLKRCYRRKKSKSPRKTLEKDSRNSTRVKKEKKDPSRKSDQVSSLKTECRKLNFPSVKKEYNRTNAEGAHRKNATRSNVKHECKICGKIFPVQRHLRIHHTVKHAKNVGSGGKTGDKNQILEGSKDQKHKKSKGSMKSNTPNGVWLCPECHVSFISRNKVKRHIYLAHGLIDAENALEKVINLPKVEAVRLIYYCSTCKESFRSLHMFDRHKNKQKGRKKCVKLYKCNLCLQRFEKKVACAGHVQKHLDLVETRKRKRSSSSSEQQSNRKRVKVRDEFKCKYCSKTFELKYLCAKHELTHTDRDPWHCYVCFKIFYLDTSIIAHMKKFHKDVSYCQKCYCIMKSKDKKRCIDCDKRRSGSALKCSICKTEFMEPSDLTHHILTHVENGDETADVTASKASKVSLDPAYQNAPNMSLMKHPVTDSPKKSKKTRNAVNYATRSKKEAVVKPKPTTNTVLDKWSASKTSKVSLDPAIQEAPKMSLRKHPVTDSPKKSKKTRSAVNDATRSKKEAVVKPKSTTNTVLDKWSASKASKVSLDPAVQEAPKMSLRKHPVPGSPKTSKKTKSAVNDATRSKKEAVVKPKPTTNTVLDKWSGLCLVKTSPTDASTSDTLKASSRPMRDGRRVTRSLSGSLPQEAQTTHAIDHAHSKYDVCMKCGERDISPKELSKHARTHLDVRSRFQCNTCQQCFASMYEIEEHGCAGKHQPSCSYTVSNVVYQCQFCGRDFLNMMEARKHVLTTNTSCLLECTECKAEYSRQGDLMVHMVSIHGQYLECDKCSAQFTRQIDLDYHTRQHEDMSH